MKFYYKYEISFLILVNEILREKNKKENFKVKWQMKKLMMYREKSIIWAYFRLHILVAKNCSVLKFLLAFPSFFFKLPLNI